MAPAQNSMTPSVSFFFRTVTRRNVPVCSRRLRKARVNPCKSEGTTTDKKAKNGEVNAGIPFA